MLEAPLTLMDPSALLIGGGFDRFGRFLVNGLVVGSVLALTAVGLTLVYGILDLANFAHGDLVTVGAYLGLFFTALISLEATLFWAGGLAAVLILLAGFDRWGRPWASQRVSWMGTSRGASRSEQAGMAYLALVLVTMIAGVRLDLPSAWLVALSALGVLLAGLWAAIRQDVTTAQAWGLAGVVAAGASAAVVMHGAWAWIGFAGDAVLPIALAVGAGLSSMGVLWVRSSIMGARGFLAALAVGGLLVSLAAGSEFLLGVVVALSAVAILSMVLDLIIWKPMRGKGAGLLTLIIISIGLALVLRNGVRMIWGTSTRTYPGTLHRAVELFGTGITITPNRAIVLGVTLVTILLVHMLLRYTSIGKAMRALADNVDLARVTGIDVDRVILYVWLIAGALAALAGVLLGTIRTVHPSLGWFLLLPIFAAVILGGIGSPYGAMAGGFVIGIGMEVSVFFGVPSAYRVAVGFGLMILVLLFRPEGIFGGQATR